MTTEQSGQSAPRQEDGSAEDADKPDKPRAHRRKPEQTRDDTDRGWGERPDEDEHESWLLEQRPPHWD